MRMLRRMSATGRGGARRPNDFYETPEWCVDALFDAEPLCGPFVDPCCGSGAILNALDRRGEAWGMDIDPELVARAKRRGRTLFVEDYLAAKRFPGGCEDTVVMNPPYKLAAEFIRAALGDAKSGRKVAALLRLNFLGSSRTRLDVVGPGSQLRAVHVLARRPSFTGDGKTDACEYAWLVWEAGYRGDASISVVLPRLPGDRNDPRAAHQPRASPA